MILKVWSNFSKRRNSTKRPPNNTAVSLDVVLKDGVSIENPSFLISGDHFNYNYAQAFGHYYFINDVISVRNGLTQINCTQDLLATYRSNIFSLSRSYIKYASEEYNNMVVDTRCAMYEPRYDVGNVANFPKMNKNGMYVLTALSRRNDGSDFTTTYLIDPVKLAVLVNEMLDTSINWTTFLKAVQSPIDSIISLKWIPFIFQASDFGTVEKPVLLGEWASSQTAIILQRADNYKHEGDVAIQIPWHYNDFRRFSPFTKLNLYVPYYGNVDIPCGNVATASDSDGVSRLHINYSVDLFTGDVTLSAGRSVDDYRILINFNLAVNCPIAQLTAPIQNIINDTVGAVGSGATAIGALQSGNAIGAGLTTAHAIVEGINSYIDMQTINKSVRGSMDGRSMAYFPNQFALTSIWFTTEDPDDYALIKGRPIFEYLPMSTFTAHSGCYIELDKTSIDMAGLGNDKDTINAFLDSGVYLE